MPKLRWGIIGAGGIADRRSIPGLLEAGNCALSVVMDVRRAQELGRKYGVPATERQEEVLAREDVDAVYVATPVHLHAGQVAAAARAGKHVLCEKPLARTAAEAKPAVAACREAGVLLREAFMMRYHGAHREIARLIGEGAIGRPALARASFSFWYPPLAGAWRQVPELGGGGSLMDMGPHAFDLLEMFLGPIRGLATRCATLVHDYPVEDAATTLLEFASGAQGMVDTFFCLPGAPTRLEIHGSGGSIVTEGTVGQGAAGRATIYRQAQADAGGVDIPYPQVNPYTRQFEDFAEAVARGEQTDPDRTLHLMHLMDAAYASARQGRFIAV